MPPPGCDRRVTAQITLAAAPVFHCAAGGRPPWPNVKTRPAPLVVLLCSAVLAGCQGARNARIQEHAAEFAALDPFSRRLVRDGLFDFGFSNAAVYMALGKPNRVSIAETPEGSVETWVYRNFMYGDMRSAGFTPNVTINPIRVQQPRSAPSGSGGGSIASPQSTIAEMGGPPLATLILDLRNGRVVAARLEF